MDHVRSHLTTSKSDCDFPSLSRDCQFWVLGEIAEEGDFSLQFVLMVTLTTDRILSHWFHAWSALGFSFPNVMKTTVLHTRRNRRNSGAHLEIC